MPPERLSPKWPPAPNRASQRRRTRPIRICQNAGTVLRLPFMLTTPGATWLMGFFYQTSCGGSTRGRRWNRAAVRGRGRGGHARRSWRAAYHRQQSVGASSQIFVVAVSAEVEPTGKTLRERKPSCECQRASATAPNRNRKRTGPGTGAQDSGSGHRREQTVGSGPVTAQGGRARAARRNRPRAASNSMPVSALVGPRADWKPWGHFRLPLAPSCAR